MLGERPFLLHSGYSCLLQASLHISDSDGSDRARPAQQRQRQARRGSDSGASTASAQSSVGLHRAGARAHGGAGERQRVSRDAMSDGDSPIRPAASRHLQRKGGRAADASDSDVPAPGHAVQWTAADDGAIRSLFPLYAGLAALAIQPPPAAPPARVAASSAGGGDDGFDDEEGDVIFANPRRGGGGEGVQPLEVAPGPGASGGPSSAALAGALLCADGKFSGRRGVTAASVAARAASLLGLPLASAAASDGGASPVASPLIAKQDRIVSAARVAAAAAPPEADGGDDAWDAVSSEVAMRDAATLALDGDDDDDDSGEARRRTPASLGPAPLRFVAAELQRVAVAR